VTAPADCEPLWLDNETDWDIAAPDPRLHDLRGQRHRGKHLNPVQLNTIADIETTGEYV